MPTSRSTLSPRLEEVVANGVPLYFRSRLRADAPAVVLVRREGRFEALAAALSYHALSRQYRLSTGLLQQNFRTLDEALNVLKRLRNWLVVDRTFSFSDCRL